MAGSGLKVFAGATKVATTAITAASTGVAALGTAAVKSYAEYEQLVGGIETLFGTGGAKTVQEYAELVGKSVDEVQGEFEMLMEAQELAMSHAANAYKDAGLSANEYMSTVTSFAASLKASTENEVEAAKAANQAVIDMADNANKMGTGMELIQNAYQGFAKQNYTMLDNLKLGYGGTKTEMERLLADATALTGIEYDINNLSDVYSAIHVIQTELGITGTTAKEASSTISGSVNAMKAAWSNLITGIADDNADFDTLVNNFVESVGVAGQNILPRMEVAIVGVGKLIEKLFPAIVDEIPQIISNVLPNLINSGINIINSLIDGMHVNMNEIGESAFSIIEMLAEAFVDLMPRLLALGARMLSEIMEGILENIPAIMECVSILISDIGEIIYDWFPELIEMGGQIILELMNGISQNLPQIVQGVMLILTQFVTTFLEMLPQIIEIGLQLIVQLALGIAQALPQLIPTIINVLLSIVDTLINNIDLLVDGAIALVIGLAEGIINALPQLIRRVPEIVIKLGDAFVRNAGKLATAALELIVVLGKGLVENIPELIKNIPQIIDAIVTTFTSFQEAIWEIGKNIVDGIWNGLSDNWDSIITWIKESAGNIWQAVKEVLGIASPSKKFKWLGEMCVAGFDKGMEGFEETDTITKGINASMKTIQANTAVSRMSSVEKGGNVKVYLEGDAGKLFRVIRVESDKFAEATGYYPLGQGG